MSPTPQYVIPTKGMSCQHCVKAVTQAILREDPQAKVLIDLGKGEVAVTSAADRSAIVQSIVQEGYEAR